MIEQEQGKGTAGPLCHYEMAELIYENHDRCIQVAVDRRTRRQVVVKAYGRGQMNDSQAKAALRECHIHSRLDHPRIARVVGEWKTEDHVYLITELLRGGDICDRVNEKKRLGERETAVAIRQLLQAVEFLHSVVPRPWRWRSWGEGRPRSPRRWKWTR